MLALILFFSLGLFTNASPATQHELTVDQQKQWRRLLHYANDQSEVLNSDFFVSANGAKDSQSEFTAFLALLDSQSPSVDQEIAVQCRFPLRFQFVEDALARTWPHHPCPELQSWRQELKTQRVDLIFASSYIGNPASSFGHTFLRFIRRGADGKARPDLLAFGVSFGANVDTENPFAYLFKGVSGHFDGRYTLAPYYQKLREYNAIDNRDLWEFEITMDPEKAVDHLWELRSARIPYYFITRNCSYQLLAFLEAVDPKVNLTGKIKAWVLPVQTLRELQRAKLIQGFSFRRAFEKRITSLWEDLNAEQKKQALTAVRGKRLLGSEDSPTLEVVAEYNLLKIQQSAVDDPLIQNFQKSVLVARERFPPSVKPAPVSQPANGPHQSSTDYALFAGAMGDSGFNSATLGIRGPSKHWLERQIDHDVLSELSIMDTRLRIGPNPVALAKLDILRISSMSPSNPLFPHWAWRFFLGGQDRPGWICDRCFFSRFEIDAGRNWALGHDLFFFVLAGAKTENEGLIAANNDTGLLNATGIIWAPSSRFALSLEAGPTFMLNRLRGSEGRLRFNFHLDEQWTIAGSAEDENYLGKEIRLAQIDLGFRF